MRYFCSSFLFIQIIVLVANGQVVKASETSSLSKVYGSLKQLFGVKKLEVFLDSLRSVFSVVKDAHKPEPTIKEEEDSFLNAPQLALKYGYPMEEHKVTTRDGYILTMHRLLPHENVTKRGGVVFLMHGIMDSSDSWILQGPRKALGYQLANKGYDVWMGNARGNKYSSSHVELNSTASKFWRFTWEEIGTFDLPAMIDYALAVTQQPKLFFVGHSQGTTSFFVMNSMRPEYNDKVYLMIALSPVAFMKHVKSPIVRLFSPANQVLAYWLSTFNTYAPSLEFINRLLSVICYIVPRCDTVLNLVVGNNNNLIEESFLPVVFAHIPSGASTLQFVHYGQLVNSGRFCRYDFGKEKNYQIYGKIKPPEYNLSKVTVPVVLFGSKNDWLSDPLDVELLASKLPKVHALHYIPDFNHLDYMYASSAEDIIYSKIIVYFENNVKKLPFLTVKNY